MMTPLLRLTPVLATLGFLSASTSPAWAEEGTPAALAQALKNTTVALQDGLKASERDGKPISGKFEIEDDALQLSVYTLKGNEFTEVVVEPKTGAIAKAEKIAEPDDLKAAGAQKAAMTKATVSLVDALDAAARANPGSRAVSIYPQLQNGNPVAEVTLLQGTAFKKVVEKLG